MKNLLRNNIWFLVMAFFSLAGFAVYLYDRELGSWLMGIGAGIALTLLVPIFNELMELSISQENTNGK